MGSAALGSILEIAASVIINSAITLWHSWSIQKFKMGRSCTKMRFIPQASARARTFRKRLDGLMKKAGELAVMCGQEVFVFSVSSEDGSVRMFGSSEKEFIPDYRLIKPEDRKGFSYIQQRFKKKSQETRSLSATQEKQVNLCLPPAPEPNLTPSFCDKLLAINKACQSVCFRTAQP